MSRKNVSLNNCLKYLCILILLNGCENIQLGCIDQEACNYNPTAMEDDGSCTYPEFGYDCNGDSIDIRDSYIGEWEFSKYSSVTHPYKPTSSDTTWFGNISYGYSNSTLL